MNKVPNLVSMQICEMNNSDSMDKQLYCDIHNVNSFFLRIFL